MNAFNKLIVSTVADRYLLTGLWIPAVWNVTMYHTPFERF